MTPLPPTWTLAPTNPAGTDQQSANATPEYVNRVTGERTPEHPGTSYFASRVEQERRRNKRQDPEGVSALAAPSPQAATTCYSSCYSSNSADHSDGSGSIGNTGSGPRPPALGLSQLDGGGGSSLAPGVGPNRGSSTSGVREIGSEVDHDTPRYMKYIPRV